MRKRPISISRYSEPEVVAALAAHLEQCNVSIIEIQTDDGHLKIVTHTEVHKPGYSKARDMPPPHEAPVLARAPIAGMFLPGHPLRPDRIVKIGRSVEDGQIAGFVKVGPVLVPVLSERAGIVDGTLAEPETFVGFGATILKAKA